MARVGSLVDELLIELLEFEVGEYTAQACAGLVTKFARAEKALAAARVRAAARATDSNVHREEGFADPSEWLARHTGDTARNANAALNTMKRLELYPATRDAVTSGEVSLKQASEILLTEEAVPGSETELLPLAKQSGLSKVRARARHTRVNAIPAEALHKHQRAARSVRPWRDELGMVAGTFRLTPEIGVPFINRLEREARRLLRETKRRGETVERFEAYVADAFAEMIQPRTSPTKKKRRDVDVVFVCDLAAYRRGHTHDGEHCHIVGGGPIPVAVAREMSKDAFLKAVLHDGVNVHTVKHFGRHIPAELRTALELGPLPDLDGVTCSEEGCDRRYGLEWDHIEPLANGETSFENVGPKCDPHHVDKTEEDRKRGKFRGGPREARPPPDG